MIALRGRNNKLLAALTVFELSGAAAANS